MYDRHQDERGEAVKRLFVLGLLLASGCSDRVFWDLKYVPTTEQERIKVSQETEAILKATPSTISGHDQDWDDAIEQAKKTAMETWCRPTLWKRIEFNETGEFKYADGEIK